jgi:chromatin segregation and condensation protein Rec8/ScpA/Scc1 (kleisin family)
MHDEQIIKEIFQSKLDTHFKNSSFENPKVEFNNVIGSRNQGISKGDAAISFLQILGMIFIQFIIDLPFLIVVLKSEDVIEVAQESAFSSIWISKGSAYKPVSSVLIS